MIKRIFAFVLLVASAFATTVTGTTKDPSTGNLFNGSISFSLNYNGGRQISTNQVLIVPRPAPQYTISNGAIPSGLTVVGNDDISPSKTIYLVAWFDLNGALVRVSPYSITGSTFDLGTAIPTPITTSNVSVLDLIGLRTLSVTGTSIFGAIIPTSITGVTTNSNAPAGAVGEYIQDKQTVPQSLTNSVSFNVVSIPLTPGDWDVTGAVAFSGTSTTMSGQVIGISNVSASYSPPPDGSQDNQATFRFNTLASGFFTVSMAPLRVSIGSNTTYYLVTQCVFSSGTCLAQGYMRARRVR